MSRPPVSGGKRAFVLHSAFVYVAALYMMAVSRQQMCTKGSTSKQPMIAQQSVDSANDAVLLGIN